MTTRVRLFRALFAGCLLASVAASRAAEIGGLSVPQSNYLLGCGGCHGVAGVSNSRLVPDLADQVGYFLNARRGRDYLVRLPNVAFYPLSDRDLTEMLNFMVFNLGGRSVPPGAKRYTTAEVARLRKHPLIQTSLDEYRKRLIDMLSMRAEVPARLHAYAGIDP